MAPTTVDTTSEAETGQTVRDRMMEATRQAAHVAREAQRTTSVAAEAGHRLKRRPFKAVGIAVGAGLTIGLAIGWIGARLAQRKATRNW